MEFGLHLHQTQKLVITPELRQAIEILQLSTVDLLDFANQALMENPLLEAVEPEGAAASSNRQVDWADFVRQSRLTREPRESGGEEEKNLGLEGLAVNELTLESHLRNQWDLMILDLDTQVIGRYLIGNLNSAGYLAMDLAQAARDLNRPLATMEKVLTRLQTLDPAGVAARDLRECLLLQIQRQERPFEEKKLLRQLVKDHLEDIGKGGLVRISKALELTPAVVQGLVDEIKKLNPKPGMSFGDGDQTTYIVPDIMVERDGEDYRVTLREQDLPRIIVNQTYAQVLLSESNQDQKAKAYVETKLNQAAWLIRCFEQRRSTILKVTEALLQRQRGFFDYGVSAMRPLTMREIAEMVGVHESTISRTVANKYIQTPHGIFELKFFFNPGIENQAGAQVSTERIRDHLRQMIQDEPAQKPLSDHQIALLLGEKGIRIARRTVAKYREEMGIPSTALRRRYE